MKKILILLACCISQSIDAALIVAPPDLLHQEGNTLSGAPFIASDLGVRYQQVYDASIFASLLPAGGGYIHALHFRVDANAGRTFATTLSNIQINFSTTTRSPDNLSAIFADNVGPDDTMVHSGSLSMDGVFAFMTAPQAFDPYFILDEPFFYDPSKGNLLLDARNFAGGDPSPFDGTRVTGDSVSSVQAFPVNSTTGFADTRGLVTLFAITPVPEPSSLVLLGLGTAGLVFASQRRRRKATGAKPPLSH